MNHKSYIILILIFLFALSLRLYGLNWDNGHHLHPDERFLTMVAERIKFPISLTQYLNTNVSPLNPYNYKEYQFFVYGTFPIFLTKYLAVIFNLDFYDKIHFLGRILSAFFDSLNIFSIYFLSRLIFKKNLKNSFFYFLPSLFYATCIFPIQLSHFFTVDTFLNFFILATFTLLSYWLTKNNSHPWSILLSPIFFGLALSCKISAILFSPIIALFFLFYFFKTKNFFYFLLLTFYFLLVTCITFRLAQPYAFTGLIKLNPKFINNLKTLQSFNDPDTWFPPAIQWLSKTPVLFPLKNIVFWGIGLPLSILFFISFKKIKQLFKKPLLLLSLAWILLLFFFQGSQFVTTMRYFLPIYPFICLLAIKPTSNLKFIFTTFIFHFMFCISFLSIYSRPHSRVQASDWIYKNVPTGSLITNESWDDSLPLNLPDHMASSYQGEMLSLYDPDTPEKWQKLNPIINNADYMIMSSNRLWGSIPLAPNKYPRTSKFYQDLFDEKLAFKKLIEINSYPGLNLPFLKKCYYFGSTNFSYRETVNKWFAVDSQCLYPGIYIRDDTSEEAFTVYDHPKVLIFKKK